MSNCYPSAASLQNFQKDVETVAEYANGNNGVPNINRDGEDVGNLQTLNAEALALAAGAANLQTYLTRAAMDADTSQPVPTVAQVTNDPDPANNQYYVWDGTSWEVSGIQPANETDLVQLQNSLSATQLDVQALERLTQGAVRINVDPWLIAHVTEETDSSGNHSLLMGLKKNGVLTVPQAVEAPGVWMAGPTVSDAIEAHTDPDGKALVMWTMAGERYQTTNSGSFEMVYSPQWIRDIENAVGRLGSGGAPTLADFRDALLNPARDANLVMIGDSITWGLSLPGNSTSTPRDHALADPRDNFDTPSWANRLRRYFGCAYADAVTTTPPTQDQPGSGYFTKTVAIDAYADPRVTVRNAAGEVVTKSGTTQTTGPRFATPLNIPPGHYARIEVQCAAINVLYATGTVDPSAQFRVEIDGATVGTQTYGAVSVQWQQSFAASWTFGKHVLVVRNLSVSQTMQLEGFTRTKQVRVANQGIIGTASWEWTGSGTLLPGAVRSNDTHAFVMLGTNDRSSAHTQYPGNVSRTKEAQRAAVRYLRDTRGLGVILVAEIAGSEAQEFPTDATKAYSMQDVRQAVIELGREEVVSVIDLYANTRLRIIKGDDFLADGLHPNEEGFNGMFNDTLSLITEVSL